MKYLDERITTTVNGLDIEETGIYVYTISLGDETIFVGNVFIQEGETSKEFDITDIVQNYAYVNHNLTGVVEPIDNIIKYFIIKIENARSIVDVYLGYRYPHYKDRLQQIFDEQNELIYNLQPGLVPVYPYKDTKEYGINNTITNERCGTEYKAYLDYKHGDDSFVSGLFKSIVSNDEETYCNYVSLSDILEHKQSKFEVKFTLGIEPEDFEDAGIVKNTFWVTQVGNVWDVGYILGGFHLYKQIDIKTFDEGEEYNFTYNLYTGARFVFKCGNVKLLATPASGSGTTTISYTLKVTDKATDSFEIYNIKFYQKIASTATEDGIYLKFKNTTKKIGEFCDNLTGYYLQWQDRMGGLQSQHFAKGHTETIDYTNTSMTNYKGCKRNINISAGLKFEINTDWIDEYTYPIYESIFTSPYLKLYDVKEDKSYNVVLTDKSFTEKTFKNQGRQLFNLKLKLEENKQQNIIY